MWVFKPIYKVVILSVARASRSEVLAQSKDPAEAWSEVNTSRRSHDEAFTAFAVKSVTANPRTAATPKVAEPVEQLQVPHAPESKYCREL